ncbi:MAG: exosortase/archaeosortase family protein [Endomicrobiales bacterium]
MRINKSIIVLGPVLLLAGLVYCRTFAWLYERFSAPESYYSHGFIVPLIAACLVWRKKDELKALPWEYDGRGTWLLAAALALHAFGTLAGVYFVSGLSLLLFVFGCALYLFGKTLTGRLLFPLSFLAFMLPLPLVAVNAVSFPLRMMATKLSVFFLAAAGLPVSSEGFRILFPRDVLVVGDPCSGLRSLISLLAMGSVFAYLLNAGFLKKTLLLLLAVPLALASNILRLIALCLLTYAFGAASVKGIYHDATGYLVFAVSFAGLWYAWRGLECARRNG